MKWYNDFSNIILLAAVPIGLLLVVVPSDPEVIGYGKLLIAGAIGAILKMVGANRVAKKAAKMILLMMIPAFLLTGCVLPQVPPNTASLIETVCDRHDEYVSGDSELQPYQRETYLESTLAIREYLEAVKPPPLE